MGSILNTFCQRSRLQWQYSRGTHGLNIPLEWLYVAVLIFVVNQSSRYPHLYRVGNWLLYLMVVMLVLEALTMLTAPDLELTIRIALAYALGGAAALCSALIISRDVRVMVKHLLGNRVGYDADSQIHTAAAVLIVVQTIFTLASFVQHGGTQGIAQDAAASPITLTALVNDLFISVLVALGGVGFYMRRTGLQTLQRLGLRLPTRMDVAMGILTGIVLYGLIFVLNEVWRAGVSPEVYHAQNAASYSLFASYTATPLTVIILLIASSVGEEILYRGALQPVFGMWVINITFALLHTQYLMTPAFVLILLVSSGFALLRHYFSTTSSIVAHFVYNAIPFILIVTLGSQ